MTAASTSTRKSGTGASTPAGPRCWAVALLAVLYTLAQIGLQGVVGPARLQAHASTALIYVACVLGGNGLAKARGPLLVAVRILHVRPGKLAARHGNGGA